MTSYEHDSNFSNWKIYVTVKQICLSIQLRIHFSNWKIYVTVKLSWGFGFAIYNFSNWKIYVTVKRIAKSCIAWPILVTEKFTWL